MHSKNKINKKSTLVKSVILRSRVIFLVLVISVLLKCAGGLTIDSQLADAKIECFIRVALGEKLPAEDSARRVDSPSITKCEKECSMDKQRCNSFSFGISAKGNGTCELSARELPDNTPIAGTTPDPDYDIYAKRYNCNDGGGGIQDPLVTPRPRPDPMFEDFIGYGGSLSNTDVNNYETNNRPAYGDSPSRPDDYGYNRPRPGSEYGSNSRPSSTYGNNNRPGDSGGSSYYAGSGNRPSSNEDSYTSTTSSYSGSSGNNRPSSSYDVKPVEEDQNQKPYNDPADSYSSGSRPSYGGSNSNRPSYGGSSSSHGGGGSSNSYGSSSKGYSERPGYNDYNQYRPSAGEYYGDVYGGYAQDSAQGDRFQWNPPHGYYDTQYSGSHRPSQSYGGGSYSDQNYYGHNYQYGYGSSSNYRPQPDYNRPGYGGNNSMRPMYDSYHGNDNYGDKYNDYRPSSYYDRPIGPEKPLYQESGYRNPGYENRHSNTRPSDGESQVYGQEISVSHGNSYRPDDKFDKRPTKKPDTNYGGYGERMPLDKPNTYGPPNKKIDGYRGNGYDNLMPDSPIYSKGSNANKGSYSGGYGSSSSYDDRRSPSYNEINRYDKRPGQYSDKGSNVDHKLSNRYDKGNTNQYESRHPGYNQNVDNNNRPDYVSKGDKGPVDSNDSGGSYQRPSETNNAGNKGGYGVTTYRPNYSDRNKGDKDRPDPRPPGGYGNAANSGSYGSSASNGGYESSANKGSYGSTSSKGSFGDNQYRPSTNYNSYGNGGSGSNYNRPKVEVGSGAKGDYGSRPSYGAGRPSERPGYGGSSGGYGNLNACYRRVLAGKRVTERYILRVVPCERLEDCQMHCAEERRFNCETFNYRLDPSNRGKGVCELSATPLTLLNLRNDFLEDRDYDFYELDRNSAPDCSLTWPEYRPGGGSYPGRPSQWRPVDGNKFGSSGYGGSSGFDDRRYECKGCNSYRPGGGYVNQYGSDRPGNDVGYYQGGSKYDNWKGWRDRDDGNRGDYDRRPYGGERRWDRGFVPYEIAGGGNDKKSWGQYGGSYGHSSHSYGSSYDYWGLEGNNKNHPNSVYPSRGVTHYHDDYDGNRKHFDQDFNYNSLRPHGGGSNKWSSGMYGGGYWSGGHGKGSWHQLQGLTPSEGYGPNDGSARPGDDDFYGPSRGFYKPYECSTRSGSGFRFNNNVVKSALTVRDVIECERFCFSDAHMKCKAYSFRYTNGPSNNCFLSDRPYPSLDLYNDVQPDRDSDIYAMNPDRRYCDKLLETHAPGGRPGYDNNLESDCFWRYRSGKRFSNEAIKAAVNCASLAQCEEECIRITTFTCRAFSFREGPPVIGSPPENCLLSDAPASALGPSSLAPSPPCAIYERGSYGRGCEGDPFRIDTPYHRPQHSGSRRKKADELCYLQYDTSAKLLQTAVRFGARLPTEHDCKVLCAQKLRAGSAGSGSPTSYFRCMSFSYSSDPGIPPTKDNCLLSDIQLRDLQPGVDYIPARTHWLFAYDMFDPDCEPVGPPGYPPDRLPPSGPPSGPPGYLPGRPAISGPSGPPGPVGPPSRPSESPDYRPGRPEPPSTHYGPPPSAPRPGPTYIPSGPSGPSGPSSPHGPSGPPPAGPGYDGNRRTDVGLGPDTWSFFTVSGWPCRKGTRCAANKVAGYWSCEIEGGEIGSWDYCCHPAHHCGHSKGLAYPWCYVGESRDQWRPCSDHYYPYAQPGGSAAHQGGPSSAPWDPRPQGPAWDKPPPSAHDRNDPPGYFPPRRPPVSDRDRPYPPDRRPYPPENNRPYPPDRPSYPPENDRPYPPNRPPYPPENDRPYPPDRPSYPPEYNKPYPTPDDRRPYPPESDRRPYRPDPERDYWDDLYKNGPQSYYDDCGNPLPGYVRVPTYDKNHIKYQHNYGPESNRGGSSGPHWIPVRPPNDDGPAFLDPPKPGGFGTGRHWPVSYLHKNGPPNSTYYNYDTDRHSTTLRPNQMNDQTTQDSSQRRNDENFDPKNLQDRPTDSPKNIQTSTKEAIIDASTRSGRDREGNLKNNSKPENDGLVLVSTSNSSQNSEEKKEKIVKTKKDTRSSDNRLDDKLEFPDDSIEIFTVSEPSKASGKDDKANLERILKEEKQIEEIGKSFRRREDLKSVVVEKRSDNEYNIKSDYKNSFEPIVVNFDTSGKKNDKFVDYNDKVKLGLPDDSFVDRFHNYSNNARTGKAFSFDKPKFNTNDHSNVHDTRRATGDSGYVSSDKRYQNVPRNWQPKAVNITTERPMKSVINNGQVFYEVAPDDAFERKQNAHIEKVDLKEHGTTTIRTNTQRVPETTRRIGGVEPITKDQAKRLKEIDPSHTNDDLTGKATSNFRDSDRFRYTFQGSNHGNNRSKVDSSTWRSASGFIDPVTEKTEDGRDQNFGARTAKIKKVELDNYGGRSSTSARTVSRGKRNYRSSYNPSEVRKK